MKPKQPLILLGILVIVLLLRYFLPQSEEAIIRPTESVDVRPKIIEAVDVEEVVLDEPEAESLPLATAAPLFVPAKSPSPDAAGAQYFQEYGDPSKTVKEDLQKVSQVLQTFWMLFKDPDMLSVADNASILKSLTGGNQEALVFISPENPYINDDGELIDRWGNPIIFHAVSMTNIEIRSKGPDGKGYTEDDVMLSSKGAVRLKK